MSEHLWYYELLNETHGPVSTDDIQQMVADGQLSEADRIRPESSEEWITVTDLKALVENVASGADEWEEVTDLDDLKFTFEDSSAGVARASEGSEQNLDEIDERHSGLDIDSFHLIGDPEEARHSAFDSVSGQSSVAIWMVQSLGQVLGPMTMTELVGMAEAGALAGTDEVRKQDQQTWEQADSITEVASGIARGAAGFAKASPSAATTSKRSAASTTGSRSGKSSKPSSKSNAGSSTGRKRRRKKKRSQKDVLLAEIFSDVFSEDGKVRDLSERPDLAKPAAQSATLRPAVDAAPATATVPPALGVSGTAMPTPPGMAAASTSGYPAASPGMPGGAAAARPAFAPPGGKKKRSGGGGFAMPEPPVLAGIAGGVLVILLGVGGYLGWFSLPGFGVSPTTLFAEFETEFPKILAKDLPTAEWEDFRGKFLPLARSVAKAHVASAESDPSSAKILNKSLLIVRILEISPEKKEARESAWENYQEM